VNLNLSRVLNLGGGIIGRLHSPLGICWSLERGWHNNTPWISCVPMGRYRLVPHDGTKYKDTFALEGGSVSAGERGGFHRTTCVFHIATEPNQLAGCIAFGTFIRPDGRLGGTGETAKIIERLQSETGPHWLDITGAKG